jgi:HJR/Mrr/RecB family endonuclease
MARRKRGFQSVFALPRRHYVRRRAKTNSGLFGPLLVVTLLLGYAFASDPLVMSIVLGLCFTAFLSFAWIIIHKRRVKNAYLAASTDLYHNSTPRSFEQRVAELFRIQGYRASVNGGANDRGIDIFVELDGERAGVQCKRYTANVQPALIREFVGALEGAGLAEGYFVTTSDYSDMARQAAANSQYTLHLIDKTELGRWQREAQESLEGQSAYASFVPVTGWVEFPTFVKILSITALVAITWVSTTLIIYVSALALGGRL